MLMESVPLTFCTSLLHSALRSHLIAAVMQSLNVSSPDCYAGTTGDGEPERNIIVDKGILQLLRVSACKSPFNRRIKDQQVLSCLCPSDTTRLAACVPASNRISLTQELTRPSSLRQIDILRYMDNSHQYIINENHDSLDSFLACFF
jgi:hypothetical protein